MRAGCGRGVAAAAGAAGAGADLDCAFDRTAQPPQAIVPARRSGTALDILLVSCMDGFASPNHITIAKESGHPEDLDARSVNSGWLVADKGAAGHGALSTDPTGAGEAVTS